MSNVHITSTTQQRMVVGTFEEALDAAREGMKMIDPWAGTSVAINPVLRDHNTGQFQWEVMISGAAITTVT